MVEKSPQTVQETPRARAAYGYLEPNALRYTEDAYSFPHTRMPTRLLPQSDPRQRPNGWQGNRTTLGEYRRHRDKYARDGAGLKR